MDSIVGLDVVGAIEGSDKSSSNRYAWDYLRHYEALFAPYRDLPINVLEIGIGHGPSLRSWVWFFARAAITGIDINPDCARYAADRVTVEIGSQIDPAFLDRVCERAPPTIILDDGSHDYAHMIFSFEHLFPKLAPGGIYVIEDIIFHRGPGGAVPGGAPNVPEYFLALARHCFAGGYLPPAHKAAGPLAAMVDRVSFFAYGVALHKRHDIRDVARGVEIADDYLASAVRHPEMAENFAEWLLRHDGPTDRAAAALGPAPAQGAESAKRALMRADILLREGLPDEARALIRPVAERQGANARLLVYAALLYARMGDGESARRAHRAAEASGMTTDVRRRFARLMQELG